MDAETSAKVLAGIGESAAIDSMKRAKWGLAIAGLAIVLWILADVSGIRALFGRSTDDSHSSRAGSDRGMSDSRRRARTSIPTIQNFCERLVRAKERNAEDEVYRAIGRKLGDMDFDILLALLSDIDSHACDDQFRDRINAAVIFAISRHDPALAADHAFGFYDTNPQLWGYIIEAIFNEWAATDLDGMTEWLRNHRDLFSTTKSALIVNGEVNVMRQLLESDRPKALAYANSQPQPLASKVIHGALYGSELPADEAIDLIRQILHGKNHEALVGQVCGLQLYSKGDEAMRSFFRDHDATPPEREAIVLRAVEMEVNMGYGGDTPAFIERVRAFAAEEAPGARDETTGIILGVVADREHDDQAAVDQIMKFDLRGPAIRAFLKQRGDSFDEDQRARIADRIDPPEEK